jgi:hypothetical protein
MGLETVLSVSKRTVALQQKKKIIPLPTLIISALFSKTKPFRKSVQTYNLLEGFTNCVMICIVLNI